MTPNRSPSGDRQPTHEDGLPSLESLIPDAATEQPASPQDSIFRWFAEASSQGLGMARFDGAVVYANPALCRILGRDGREAIGTDVATYYTETDRHTLESSLLPEVLSAGQVTVEMPLVSCSGRVTPAIQSIFLVPNQAGEPICFANVITDLTQRKQMEARLRQSEKMEAIGHLAGGVAHDFNNRLVSIQGFAQLLAAEVPDAAWQQYANRIVTSAKRAAHLTRQLLAFARLGDYQRVPVDMHTLIHETVLFLEHSLRSTIRIQQHLKAVPCTTQGDPAQLQGVLLNLALNARDAMPDGGQLTLSTEVLPPGVPAGAPRFPALSAAPCLCITVADTGHGMDEATRRRAFEPFFTTKSENQGTGMGLASAYGTVQNHGGDLEIESAPGHGTTIRIYLPLDESGEANTQAPCRPPIAGHAQVLVVDDDDDARDLIETALGKLGYQVQSCVDGAAALGVFRDAWKDLDIVILDMVMPRMDGRQTLAAMRAIHPGVKALLVTAYSMSADTRALMDEGIVDVVSKPFDMAELTERIERLLRTRAP